MIIKTMSLTLYVETANVDGVVWQIALGDNDDIILSRPLRTTYKSLSLPISSDRLIIYTRFGLSVFANEIIAAQESGKTDAIDWSDHKGLIALRNAIDLLLDQ